MKQYQEPAFAELPRAISVNTIGGNLYIKRVDMSIDTYLGAWVISAAYNSASGQWMHNFDMSYDGTAFLDDTGALYNIESLANGERIPGTHWVKVNGTQMKTVGGLLYDFSNGHLEKVFWTDQTYPRLVLHHGTIAGASRVTAIKQCLTATANCFPVFTMNHDAATGRLISIVDRAGRQATFTYDQASGDLLTARDPLAVEKGWPGFRYTYSNDKLASIFNSENEEVTVSYGLAGRVSDVKYIGLHDPRYRFEYHVISPSTAATSVYDPDDEETQYIYYLSGTRRLKSRIDPMGDEESFTWTSDLQMGSHTDAAGLVTDFGYEPTSTTTTEPSGNVIVLEHPNYFSPITNREFRFRRPVVHAVDSVGLIVDRTYDPTTGRVISERNGEQEETSFEYDLLSLLWKKRSPSAQLPTQYGNYDEHGHPRWIDHAKGTFGAQVEEPTYDAVGNQLTGFNMDTPTSPGRPGITARAFDANRNLMRLDMVEFDGSPETTVIPLVIERRSDGRPTKIFRPYGADTEFEYDALGRLVEKREKADEQWHAEVTEYDAVGRITAVERPNGMRRETDWDAAGRVSEIRFVRGGVTEQSVHYTFADGRVSSRLDSAYRDLDGDPDDNPETFEYDTAGRIANVTFPLEERLSLAHDLRSRVISADFLDSSGSVLEALSVEYDLANRETAVLGGDLTALRSRTFTNGQLVSESFANGLTRTYQYDPETGEFTASNTINDSGQPVETTTLDVTGGSVYQTSTQTFGSIAQWTGNYHRVQPQAYGRRAGSATASYAYDALNNPVSPVFGVDFYYNGERNRLTRAVGNQYDYAYVYDEAGFVTNRGGVPLTWSAGGRMTSIGPDTFAWDTEGRPVSMVRGGQSTLFRFGGLVEGDAATPFKSMDLGFVKVDLVNGAHLYRHLDWRRTDVKFVTDQSGNVVFHYNYQWSDDYGPLDTAQLPPGLSFQAIYATGTAEDDRNFAQGRRLGNGLYLLGARVYDSYAKRFLSPDPIDQVVNQFVYSEGNPTLLWDPDGRFPRPTDSGAIDAGQTFQDAGQAMLAIAGLVAVLGLPASIPLGLGLVTTAYGTGLKYLGEHGAFGEGDSGSRGSGGSTRNSGPAGHPGDASFGGSFGSFGGAFGCGSPAAAVIDQPGITPTTIVALIGLQLLLGLAMLWTRRRQEL